MKDSSSALLSKSGFWRYLVITIAVLAVLTGVFTAIVYGHGIFESAKNDEGAIAELFSAMLSTAVAFASALAVIALAQQALHLQEQSNRNSDPAEAKADEIILAARRFSNLTYTLASAHGIARRSAFAQNNLSAQPLIAFMGSFEEAIKKVLFDTDLTLCLGVLLDDGPKSKTLSIEDFLSSVAALIGSLELLRTAPPNRAHTATSATEADALANIEIVSLAAKLIPYFDLLRDRAKVLEAVKKVTTGWESHGDFERLKKLVGFVDNEFHKTTIEEKRNLPVVEKDDMVTKIGSDLEAHFMAASEDDRPLPLFLYGSEASIPQNLFEQAAIVYAASRGWSFCSLGEMAAKGDWTEFGKLSRRKDVLFFHKLDSLSDYDPKLLKRLGYCQERLVLVWCGFPNPMRTFQPQKVVEEKLLEFLDEEGEPCMISIKGAFIGIVGHVRAKEDDALPVGSAGASMRGRVRIQFVR